MLTNIKIENFKKLGFISFPLAQSVVIIGPNNSGKSTIFQALCLWEIGVKNFISASQRRDLTKGSVILNRKDLLITGGNRKTRFDIRSAKVNS